MRYVMSALVVLVVCSSPAFALRWIVRVDPQAQRDAELLMLLDANIASPITVLARGGRVRAIGQEGIERLDVGQEKIPKRLGKVRVVDVPENLLQVRMGPIIAPAPAKTDSSLLNPTINDLTRALTEADSRLFASVWDVENAKFIDIRNGKVVTQHSLTGKAEGRIKRIRRLVRAERLQTWLDAPKPVNVSSDRKSALIHLRNEKRGPILDATSLHLKQKGDGTWMVVALVHSIRGT